MSSGNENNNSKNNGRKFINQCLDNTCRKRVTSKEKYAFCKTCGSSNIDVTEVAPVLSNGRIQNNKIQNSMLEELDGVEVYSD